MLPFLKGAVMRPLMKRTSLDFAAFVWFIISLPWQQEDGGSKSVVEVDYRLVGIFSVSIQVWIWAEIALIALTSDFHQHLDWKEYVTM